MVRLRRFAGEMRAHAVQAEKSVVDELRGRGRSGVRQRTALVQEIFIAHPANRSLAAVRHVFWHVQRVHGHHRYQLPPAVRVPHGTLRTGHPDLYRRTAHTAHTAQLRAQPQVPGARFHDCQPPDGRRSGHHVLLSALRHAPDLG